MQFNVEAYREPEGLVRLVVESDSAREVTESMGRDGYEVLQVSVQSSNILKRRTAQKRFSVPLFSRELAMLLEAGLGIVEIIDLLRRKSKDTSSRAVLDSLHTSLRHGKTLSASMEAIPDAFSPLYIATIRSSEQTSNLVEALNRYLAYHDKMHALRAKIVSASIYPAIVLSAGGLVIVFLMTYVVPRFGKIYEDVGGDLPLLFSPAHGLGPVL